MEVQQTKKAYKYIAVILTVATVFTILCVWYQSSTRLTPNGLYLKVYSVYYKNWLSGVNLYEWNEKIGEWEFLGGYNLTAGEFTFVRTFEPGNHTLRVVVMLETAETTFNFNGEPVLWNCTISS